jgi:rubrerythrin
MEFTHGQLRDFIRSIHDRPNGTGALLNLVRASEVRAAAELSCLADVILDDQLRLDVTRHAADEARHAHLLVRRMGEIGFAPSRLPPAVDRTEAVIAQCRARDVKQVWNERGTFTDEEILELLVAAAIAERDAVPKLEANHDVLERDPHTQSVIGSILRDEHRHVEYLDGWVERFERRVSAEVVRATRARLQAAFDTANVAFYAGFEDYLRSAAARLAA